MRSSGNAVVWSGLSLAKMIERHNKGESAEFTTPFIFSEPYLSEFSPLNISGT